MIKRIMFCAGVLAVLAACGDSDSAEEQYFDHYQESVEEAREVGERLERIEERRREMLEEHEP